MTRLNPDSREVIELARDLDDPTDDDRSRHRAKLLGRLGAAAALTISVPAGASGALVGAGTVGTVASGAVLKSALVFALLGAMAGGAVCAVGESLHINSPSLDTPAEPPARPSSHQPIIAGGVVEKPVASLASTEEERPSPAPAPPVPAARREPRETLPVAPQQPAPIATASGRALQEEVDLILHAHEALRSGDAALALRYVAEHAAQFPNGALAPERVATRVLAVCSLHRAGAADEARAFLAARPDSPLAARVRTACGL